MDSHQRSKVLVFGPQNLQFDGREAAQLQATVLEDSRFGWIVPTLLGLSQLHDKAAEAISVLREFPNNDGLSDISCWIKTGCFENSPFPLPNSILTPLVVVTQLVHYVKFLNLTGPQEECGLSHAMGNTTEVVGLCTGLLSAAAVSCSHEATELERHGAVAIRLAMLIGSIVDAQDKAIRTYSTLSIEWTSLDLRRRTMDLIDADSDSYISVIVDENKATVTSRDISALQQKLHEMGVKAVRLNLNGQFHSSRNAPVLREMQEFCDLEPLLQLPDAEDTIFRMWSNKDGGFIQCGPLHHQISRSILVDQSDWHTTFQELCLISMEPNADTITFGAEGTIPDTLIRRLGSRLVHMSRLSPIGSHTRTPKPVNTPILGTRGADSHVANGVAIVGMSGHFAGATDLEELWEVLYSGSSQHRPIPPERLTVGRPPQDHDSGRKWFGNFVNDHDCFDNTFFKKSPREGAAMDPQHRMMLQMAYQAVEQSGAFNKPHWGKNIACFIGVMIADHERTIDHTTATPHSATGNLRCFTAGQISHYFGWTGQNMTVDSGCSSSAVAIHLAYEAIKSGQVSGAIAGGVNIMTGMEWFHNFAAASFLSPTGQCKPFDASADGYCRGEGAGALFLKSVESALADGDQIWGVILGSTVQQNENITPITVPNSSSLSDLFHTTLSRTNLKPKGISYIEAHGTGTPVGDPAEYRAIRQLVEQEDSQGNPVYLGSIKGCIGHTEAASGVAAVLKTVLMIQKGIIPPHASFRELNPVIEPSSQIQFATSPISWGNLDRIAMVSNYGASGSNACLAVAGSPLRSPMRVETRIDRQPFWLTGLDTASLQRYAVRMGKFLRNSPDISLATASFQVSRQSNRRLPQASIFSCCSTRELIEKLEELEQGSSATLHSTPEARPVILCFGGQVSRSVPLPRVLYEEAVVFRNHLDEYNAVCESKGLLGIFPSVFEATPIENIVELHVMLFGVQYACARAWMDCGIEPVLLLGFSFGELTALCVSGSLNLSDAVSIIAGRARIIQHGWGADAGGMLAIKGTLGEVRDLINDHRSACSIACFNGPSSFTLAGPVDEIEAIECKIRDKGLQYKRLAVTNGFHCSMVEPLMDDLQRLGQHVQFSTPDIPLEHMSRDEVAAVGIRNNDFFAEHLRQPVYFHDTVQRVARQYPDAIWLEAGFNSGIANMAHQALGKASSGHFQGFDVTHGIDGLMDTTIGLWEMGINTNYWLHHAMQATMYDQIFLPPYQFEKKVQSVEARHSPSLKCYPVIHSVSMTQKPMVNPAEYLDSTRCSVRFLVDTGSTQYQDYVAGHDLAQAGAICPIAVQLSIAIDAFRSLYSEAGVIPGVYDVVDHLPLRRDPSQSVWVYGDRQHPKDVIWNWRMVSNRADLLKPTVHCSGRISWERRSVNDGLEDLIQSQNLITAHHCQELLNTSYPDEALTSPRLYTRYSHIIDYGPVYQRLQKIVSKGKDSAARMKLSGTPRPWLDPAVGTSFCQVSNIFVNLMLGDKPSTAVHLPSKIHRWVRLAEVDDTHLEWDVFATHRMSTTGQCIGDTFIFHPKTGALIEAILGIQYQEFSTDDLGQNKPYNVLNTASLPPVPVDTRTSPPPPQTTQRLDDTASRQPETNDRMEGLRSDVKCQIRKIISSLSGVKVEQIHDQSSLSEMGIDSLMAMELAGDLEGVLSCKLETRQLLQCDDFKDLIVSIEAAMGVDNPTSQVKLPQSNTPNSEIPPVSTLGNVTSGIADVPDGVLLNVFTQSKKETDNFVHESGLYGFEDDVLPKSNELCVALIADAFAELGCSLTKVEPGQTLERIQVVPRHKDYVDSLYSFLEKDAHVIDMVGGQVQRTSVSLPHKPAQMLLDELNSSHAEYACDHQLLYMTGRRLADCLSGEIDALDLIFGSPTSRDLLSRMYAKSPINLSVLQQLHDIMRRLLLALKDVKGRLNILEVGAGTGGTTWILVKLLQAQGFPVLYTFTDISPSLVVAARRTFKNYSFVETRVLDIEQDPPEDLVHSQHIVIATNCVHATRNIRDSTRNIHKLLRPDGALMLVEMTRALPWVNLVFGLIEGWWLFNDGRTHALSAAESWKSVLQSVGYGHVDWTQGSTKESTIQRIIIAFRKGGKGPRSDSRLSQLALAPSTELGSRSQAIESYLDQYTAGFTGPSISSRHSTAHRASNGRVVLVTGATGSLGSHLVAHLCSLPEVRAVFCANRARGVLGAQERQDEAFETRGIGLDDLSRSKLHVLEVDLSDRYLGFTKDGYDDITKDITDIFHNAWPMSVVRALEGFTSQFQVMRNMIDLARDIASHHSVGFQFISSIATIGQQPLRTGDPIVLEKRVGVESAVANGYGDAKLICEKMLDRTLHLYPESFSPTVIRIGQICGSTTSGYWNPLETLPAIMKSSQTLKRLPQLEGTLSWCPVDSVASIIGDLLLQSETGTKPHPVYHIVNPSLQPWHEMIGTLAVALDICPDRQIIPFERWIQEVRQFHGSNEDGNPAAMLIDFIEQNFVHMFCGGLHPDTTMACQHSQTLRTLGPVMPEMVLIYVHVWKKMGFLG